MGLLTISLLGPFRVARDGRPVTAFHADTARALLAYLAMNPGIPHRREALAGLLWPDRTDSEARHDLSQALMRLRQATGDEETDPPLFRVTREAIEWNAEGPYWLDVAAFRAAMDASHQHPHRHVERCDSCLQRLVEATEIYRGDLLSGFSVASPAFEQWLVVERERLHQDALEVLAHLAAHHEGCGEHEAALRYARRQLELEPWLESAHRQAMRALALSGQRSAALAQYEACRRALAEELGVKPEQETTALWERIQAGDLAGLGDLRGRGATPPHNLPAPLTPFVGRKQELEEIGDLLSDPTCRLLTLVGPGGIGKTRLALEAARACLSGPSPLHPPDLVADRPPDYPDGVFFIPLGSLTSADAIAPTVVHAMGLSSQFSAGRGESASPWQFLLGYLRTKSILLVLDGFEGLLPGADMLTQILQAAPQVRLIVTSRAELNVQGEYLLPLGGMEYPRLAEPGQKAPASVVRYGAVELFLAAALRAQPGFEPTAEDMPYVGEVCRLVQGVPLAILLAASWIKALTPAEIVSHLGRPQLGGGSGLDLDFLAAEWRDVPSQQHSMRAVLDRSWSLLSARQQEVVAALSVFRGGFTAQAARQVAGASPRELLALVGCSLLQRAPVPSLAPRTYGRFVMHDLLRQYAAEKLADWPDGGAGTRDRHCACYLAALGAWATGLDGPRRYEVLDELAAEIDNVEAAWDRGLALGQAGALRQGMDGLCRFYEANRRYPEGEALCCRTVERLSPVPGPQVGLVTSKALAWQSWFGMYLGLADQSRQLAEESLALLEWLELANQDVRQEKAFALTTVASGLNAVRQIAQAKRLWTESLALARAVGSHWLMSETLSILGWTAIRAGLYEEARRFFEEELVLHRKLGIPSETADTLISLGRVEQFLGRPARALELMRAGLAASKESDGAGGSPFALHMLAVLQNSLGRYAEARSLQQESIRICQELGWQGGDIPDYWAALGEAELHLGQYEQARAHFQSSRGMNPEGRWRPESPYRLLGAEALARGAYAEAHDWLQEGLAIYRQLPIPRERAWTSALLGIAEWGLGHPAQARHCFREALPIVAQILGNPTNAAPAFGGVALLLADAGEVERAVELYAFASRDVPASRWLHDVVGQRIAMAAAALPPEVVAAAQERGRARDLQTTTQELLEALQSE